MAINEQAIQDRFKKQIDNEITLQRQSINQGLQTKKQEFDNTINQNKSYLDEQIKTLNTQRIQNADNITTLQNRRGGFYSGGMDYQLAENTKSIASSQNTLTRDITTKNQEMLSQYNTLASQASDQIRLLEQQAPDKIRQLVNEELEKQRQIKMQEERWALEKQQMQIAIDNARAEAARAAESARVAAASRSSSNRKSSSSSKTSSSKSSSSNLTKQYNQYKANQPATKPAALSNLDKYYQNQSKYIPVVRKKSVLQPVAPAKNKNLSAWQKMKMMGV